MEHVLVNIPNHENYLRSRRTSYNNVFEVTFVDMKDKSRYEKLIVCAGCTKEDLANIIDNHIVAEFPDYIEIKELNPNGYFGANKVYLKEFVWILDNITLQVVNSPVRERIRFV